MPPKKKSRKPNSSAANSQYTAELSSSQLVVGIAILLIFGLACFLFGVLIGKFDPSLQQRVAQNTDLGTIDLTEGSERTAPSTKSSTDEPKSTPIEKKTVIVTKPPLAKPVVESPQVPESAQSDPATIDASTTAKAEPTPKPRVEIPKDTPKATTQSTTTKPNTPDPPTVVTSASPAGTTYAVQIASYKVPSSAESERSRLSKAIPYDVHLHRANGSEWTRVLVGSYPTHAEADKLREVLISRYSFDKPWVFEVK